MFDFVELKVRKMRNLWYLVACGELSSVVACGENLQLGVAKSYKSKQIKQIYLKRFGYAKGSVTK